MMELTLTKDKPLAAFAFKYSFSKIIVEKFRVPTLFPDSLPVIKITVKKNGKIKEYRIDTKNSLDDEMEQPEFDVFTEFPIKAEPTMTIEKTHEDWIKLELEKGDWITIQYKLKGNTKRVK